MKPELVRICLFPIKSLEGVVVEAAGVLGSGTLEYDRRWRMVDRQGRTVNGKRTAAVHRVAARFDVQRELVWLDVRGGSLPRAYHLVEEWPAIQRRLSELLDIEVMLIEDAERGFPDDTDAPGPTWVSTATLETVASWFDGLPLDQVRAVPGQSGDRRCASVLGGSIGRRNWRRDPLRYRFGQAVGRQAVRAMHRAEPLRRDG